MIKNVNFSEFAIGYRRFSSAVYINFQTLQDVHYENMLREYSQL